MLSIATFLFLMYFVEIKNYFSLRLHFLWILGNTLYLKNHSLGIFHNIWYLKSPLLHKLLYYPWIILYNIRDYSFSRLIFSHSHNREIQPSRFTKILLFSRFHLITMCYSFSIKLFSITICYSLLVRSCSWKLTLRHFFDVSRCTYLMNNARILANRMKT